METAQLELVFSKDGIIIWDLSRCKDNSGLFSAVERLLLSATVRTVQSLLCITYFKQVYMLHLYQPLNCFLLIHADWDGDLSSTHYTSSTLL